jgi:hypothetical protein
MWLRLAVIAAATISMMPAQTWEVSPLAGYLRLSKKPIGSVNSTSPKADDTLIKGSQPVFGVRATWNTKGYYGIEGAYLRSKARVDSKIVPLDSTTSDTVLESGRVWLNQISVDGLAYFMPSGERFRPYIAAGAQVQIYGEPPLPDWTIGRGPRSIGFNYGGGIKIRLFPHAQVRLDVRDIWGGSPYDLSFPTDTTSGNASGSGGHFRQVEATMGVGITF